MRLLAWIILSAATAAMAGAYAFAVGGSHGEVWAWISAASVVALLVAESALAGDRGSACAPAIRWPALCLAMLALLSLEAGFLSSTASDARATRQDAARVAELRAARVTAEPAAAIRARLEGHEARHRGIRASWCGSTSTEVRTACDTWTALRADLATAEAGEAMVVPGTAAAVGEADARADLLSRVIGGTSERWADAATLLLAAALSFARLACAASLFGVTAPPARTVAPVPVDTASAQQDQLAPAPVWTVQFAPAPVWTVQFAPVAMLPVQQDQPAAEPDVPAPPAAVEAVPTELAQQDQPAVLITKAARQVLRRIAAAAEAQPDGTAIVPPGHLSPDVLAKRTGLPRRQVTDSIDVLQRAGMLQVTRHGRAGTGFAVTRAAG